MKRKIFSLFAIITLAGVFKSCTKNFEEINTDPNRISQISPGTLLNPTLYSLASYYIGKADDFSFHLMQVKVPYPAETGGIHIYDVTENSGSGLWNTSYRWLTNIEEMYQASENLNEVNYMAISLTLKAWVYSILTDAFGSVPMEEATKGAEGILRPKFNTQQEIYNVILADLERANTLYDLSRPMAYGTEILFENNLSNWKKFTNSLRMRLLLRVSNKAEMNSWNLLNTMISDPVTYPVFNSNSESAIMDISGVSPMLSPWGRAVDFTSFRAAAEFFVETLNDFEDPRRGVLLTQARTKDGSADIGYKGIPSGYNGNINQFDFLPSNFNINLVTAPMVIPVFPYAEVEFIKAEVHHHFSRETEAKAAYEKGTKASIEQWGATMPADYFDNPDAAYDGTLERIMLQKYIALFFVDYQQWFEYRRTGYPELPTTEFMLNNRQMPVRYFYPINIRSTNTENYNKAVEQMGGDNLNIKAWWQN